MSIGALIADDEAAARSRLRRALAEFTRIEVIGEARDGLEAVTLIGQLAPELLFLDVQMPGLDGFEVLRALPADVPRPQVIFATAFDQHALEGLTKVKTAATLYRTDYGLSELECRLPNPPFVRAHRSTIVNLGMVTEIAPLAKGSYVLIMKDQQRSELQVSERQSKWVRELLRR